VPVKQQQLLEQLEVRQGPQQYVPHQQYVRHYEQQPLPQLPYAAYLRPLLT
jgi:hypothetical protein